MIMKAANEEKKKRSFIKYKEYIDTLLNQKKKIKKNIVMCYVTVFLYRSELS